MINHPTTYPPTHIPHHQRQPIHFYQSSRPSLQYPTSLIYLSSPTQSPPKKQTQRNPSSPSSSVSMEQFMSVNRVMQRSYKSDKYRELRRRLEVLESNLNRLNGQHQGLGEMFQRVEEVVKCNGVLFDVDQLRERLKASQEKFTQQQHKLKQRYSSTYSQYHQLFTQLHPHPHPTQPPTSPPTTHPNPYQTLYLTHSLTLTQLQSNITRHLTDISLQLQHDADRLLEHFGVGQRIREEKKMVEERVDRVRRKLGELRCVVEFEVVEGGKGVREGRGRLKVAGRYDAKDYDNDKVEETKTSSLVKQLRMVSSQSIDRLAYQLTSIDTNFVILIQSHQQQPNPKSPPKKPHPQSQQSPHKLPQPPQPPHHLLTQLSTFNQQLYGFKRYFEKTVAKLQGLGQLQGNMVELSVHEEINAIVEAMRRLEDEAKVLGENLEYFGEKCVQ